VNSHLLATKLRPPAIPPKRTRRPQLVRRLNDGLAAGRQITLLSAPAGFGKTVCVGDWVSTLEWPVTWLTLDPADDEPQRFFTYFCAALQQAAPGVGEEIAALLAAGQLPPGEIISATLINDLLAAEHSCLLILDDLHLIQDRFILQVLQTLVGNLPPALHLVLLTREDPDLPLARLRARNQLTEIRAGDLRFTRPETADFLSQVMGLSLAQSDIASLADKTEGWIAGLQLAGLSIRDRADRSAFIAGLRGTHRFILSYLTEEVLQRRPPEIQDFLLQTSVLERLTGALCDGVTGRADSVQLLEQLLSANLFLIPLDDEGRWYRYHPLFADLLRDRQLARPKGETLELHRRASRWYAQAGMGSEAIDHALAATDYAAAVALMEDHAPDMLMQWHKKRVQDWMQALPPAWAARCLKTSLALTWMLLSVDPAQALPHLERLGAMFSAPQLEVDPALQAQWLALQACLLNTQSQPAQSVELAQRAVASAPPGDHYSRSMVYTALATAYELMDDYDRAVEAYQMLIQHGRSSANLVSELLGRAGLALMAMQRGRLRFAFDVASQGIERVERSGALPPISQALYGELGEITYQWHQLAQAHRHFQRAIHVATLSGYSDAQLYYDVILSRLHQIQGDLAGAAGDIEHAQALMKAEAPAAVREEVVAQQVRVYLAQGRLPEAELALAQQGLAIDGDEPSALLAPERATTFSGSLLLLSVLRVHLFRAKARADLALGPDRGLERLRPASELADRLIDRALHSQHTLIVVKALLLRSQMHAARGDEQDALADVARAVAMAEPQGAISLFVEEGPPIAAALAELLELGWLDAAQADYTRRILTACAEPAPPTGTGDEGAPVHEPSKPSSTPGPAAAVEPLSERELDVLRLMAEGLTYQEIGERLFISLNTVRSHVKAVYGKLGVNNRTQAIASARREHLLQSEA
jgi:LuxR family maltose regulon positive regulatory protein